jgi:hypothetical protein
MKDTWSIVDNEMRRLEITTVCDDEFNMFIKKTFKEDPFTALAREYIDIAFKTVYDSMFRNYNE